MCSIVFRLKIWNYLERIKEIIQNPSSFLIKSKAANERVNLQCGFENTITQEIKLMDSTSILSNDL